jgi:phosphoglycerate kinase
VALAKTAAALTREGSLISVAGGGGTVAALSSNGWKVANSPGAAVLAK